MISAEEAVNFQRKQARSRLRDVGIRGYCFEEGNPTPSAGSPRKFPSFANATLSTCIAFALGTWCGNNTSLFIRLYLDTTPFVSCPPISAHGTSGISPFSQPAFRGIFSERRVPEKMFDDVHSMFKDCFVSIPNTLGFRFGFWTRYFSPSAPRWLMR